MITAEQEKAVVAKVRTQLLIGGTWRDARSGRRFPVEDPSTREILAEVPDAGPEDAVDAMDAATEAQAGWAARPPRERGEVLRRAFETILERTEELALLMTLEMGKPLADSRAEIAYAAEFFRWFSEEAVRVAGHYTVAPDGRGRLLTMRQPVGPSLLITPWNFPMAMATRKIGPAVAAGCTMILKPAEQTPLSALALARILEECGLPPGVLNLITTTSPGPVTEPILRDSRVRKLSFTGSTEVGQSLIALAAGQVLRMSMELGGNAPFIVFDDADFDAAVEGALLAKMRNVGEACTAANRFHVAEPIAREFSDALGRRLGALKLGRGTEDGVQVGPLIDEDARLKVSTLVRDALDHGANVVVGAEAGPGAGYFYRPTVLRDVPAHARALREEIFGPVAPVASFESEEEALAAANDTEFGLVAYVYTRDLKRAFRVVEGLRTGMVGLNQGYVSNPAAPFGGVKRSGFGREGGREGIQEYLDVKYVAMNLCVGMAAREHDVPASRCSPSDRVETRGVIPMADLTFATAARAGMIDLGGDLRVNRLGFGAMRITGSGIWGQPRDDGEAKNVLRRAVELGVNFIDTADSYGPHVSESLIAEALSPYPDDLVIATKGGLERPGPNRWTSNGHPDHLRSACEGSLRRLRIDRIPLYQFHAPDPDVPYAESIGALVALKDEGKIRHIGISNVREQHLREAARLTPVASIQNRYNIGDRRSESIVDLCEREGIAFIPWAPILDADDPKLRSIAKKHGGTQRQVALAWLLSRSPSMLPIPGTGTIGHLEENVAAAALRLDRDDVAELSHA